ncbi:MAG: hypothetical protein GX596_09305 [Propionibacterium sp.]|nr:hypothetical protein [Propionibacterium sp.]
MLAGILIAALLVVGLAFAIPWISAQRQHPDELAEEPTERFSQSMRILQRDVIDFGDPSAVSTPLTRASEFYGLHMTAKLAARRRLLVLSVLGFVVVVLTVVAVLGHLPWWAPLVPAGLVVAFLTVARFSVVGMHRRLDAYAADVAAGFGDDEATEVIDITGEDTQSLEFSVDLAAPTSPGVFWDPVPVTALTYVQKPLLPRTVRTIDLSAPVVESTPLVPTADHPDDVVAEESVALPRAVGE